MTAFIFFFLLNFGLFSSKPFKFIASLDGGFEENEGNVMINGRPVCDDDWNDEAATVVCRMLGYLEGEATYESEFGDVDEDDFILDDVQCTGDEQDLMDCEYLYNDHDCYGDEGAGVRCKGHGITDRKGTTCMANKNEYSAFSEPKQCVFPFKYNGIVYHGCTDFEWDALWCATKTSANGGYIEGEWGNCDPETCKGTTIEEKCMANANEYSTFSESKQCVFPFIYKGTTYHECTDFEWYDFWCATKTRKNGNYIEGEWGNCDSKTCKGAPNSEAPWSEAPYGGELEDEVPSNEEYCNYVDSHTMCIYPGPSVSCASKTIFRGLSEEAKQLILDRHNELRSYVALGLETNGAQPSASNMKKLVWNDEIAASAQRWADQCNFGHDSERSKIDGTRVGQNVFIGWTSDERSYESVMEEIDGGVDSWYNEVKDPGFNSGNIDPFVFSSGTGHYTQVVWADTEELGCGMVYYDDNGWFARLVVCNYAIGGNMIGGSMYELGDACSKCPEGTSCEDGLCA